MELPLEPIRVANSFVSRYASQGDMTHMKLQKLCYYAYGWWLALCPDEPALMRTRPQVWKFGPVFQPVYSAFAGHKNEPIDENQIKPIGPFQRPGCIEQSDRKESQIVDWIWTRYGQFSATELSSMTHEIGTPWYNRAQQHNFLIPRFTELTDEEIRPYFLDIAKKEGFIQ